MLPETGFMSNASTGLREMMTRAATALTLADGETLFEQGDVGDSLYVVTGGAIELSVLSREGKKLALDVMRPGDLFGEIALFDPSTRTAGAIALGETSLLSVGNTDLQREIKSDPQLAIDLVRMAGQRMRLMSRQLSEQVFLPLPSRLARKILHLTAHDKKDHPKLTMSQADLAEFAGATREVVSKTLSSWETSGFIQKKRGGMQVVDREALKTIALLDEF